ncbi:MAG: 23S rRNA (guanosine(2251)-2'-O)-methyltransferase RlmB [Firmicutes bacterium]|nr:23S rRNA (guanosine(2251)-2'-O)-methyltransferase RlmB [Bacillota bacterium]
MKFKKPRTHEHSKRTDSRVKNTGRRDAAPQAAPKGGRPRREAPAAYREREAEPTSGVVCGKNPVLETLRSGRTVNKVIAAAGQEPGFLRQVRELCRQQGVPFLQQERAQMDAAWPNHRGVVALTAPFDYVGIDDILANAAQKGEPPLVVVLAGVEDPHNLGAVLRTVEGIGAHGVIIARHGAAPLNETAAQVAAGAAEYVPVARVANIANALEELKSNGLWVCGTRMEKASVLWDADMTGPLALVMGSEGKGLPPVVAAKCDFFVRIPQRGHITSYNVSVSCGMVLAEILRQRMVKAK